MLELGHRNAVETGAIPTKGRPMQTGREDETPCRAYDWKMTAAKSNVQAPPMATHPVREGAARGWGNTPLPAVQDELHGDVPAPGLTNRRQRLLFGSAVVGAAVMLQAATQFFLPDKARALVHTVYLVIEVPILMVALSAMHAWAHRRKISSTGAIIAGTCVAGTIGVVCGTIFSLVGARFGLHAPTLQKAVLFGFSYSQLYFGLWTLAFVYPFATEDARVRALEADKLRSMAELARLRAQLEPHFLLNTLNAIAGLVTEDPREARRLIACLGDLLRDALRDDQELQSLKEEIAWLKRYAAILEARHRGELHFEWHIAKELSDVLLPRLLLQPLVENAVKHGALRRKGGGGQVVVRAFVEGGAGKSDKADENDEADKPNKPNKTVGKVVFVVEDNGPGLPDRTRNGTFGLHAVRRRLSLRYPGSDFRLTSSPAGTVSTVEIPRAALTGAAPAGARAVKDTGAVRAALGRASGGSL